MKLVFPGGEHPQGLLGLGVNRVGSDPGANVVIDRPGVNPQHCRLHVTGQGVMLDVPEGTPISVNGRQVDGLIALRPGDAVDLGGVVARLAGIGAPAPEPSGAVETALVSANDDLGATSVRPAMPKYALRGVGGSAFGRSIAINGTMTIGRAPECTLTFEDSGLSRMHARLMPTDDGLLLEDRGSSNGSFINGRRVARGLVGAGDEIAFDTLRFRLVGGMRHAGREDGERRRVAHVPHAVWALVAIAAVAGLVWWGVS